MLDKQLEEYNKQKEEEQQKEEELNKANSISTLANLGDTMNITIKDTIYNNTYGTTDTSGTYSFKLVYKSTNTLTSGSKIYLLCTKQLAFTDWDHACKYNWSANLKDSNNNLYQFTDIKIPTYDRINRVSSNSLRKTGFIYWTSTDYAALTAYYVDANGSIGQNAMYASKEDSINKGNGVIPIISLTFK